MNYAALSKPFSPQFINRVNKGSHSEDYVNHAVVTDRLNRVHPGWAFEILNVASYTDDKGMPHVAAVTVRLTVDGIARDEVGTVNRPSKYGDEIKAAVSDALKRGAMRFGVAIQLWHELPPAEALLAGQDAQTKPSERAAKPGAPGTTPPGTGAPQQSAGSEQAGPASTGAADERTTNAHEEGGASVESQSVGKRLPSAGECAHTSTSPLKLDGQALPKGYVRCVECNALSDKQGVIK